MSMQDHRRFQLNFIKRVSFCLLFEPKSAGFILSNINRFNHDQMSTTHNWFYFSRLCFLSIETS